MVKQMLPLSSTFPLNSLNVYPKLTICNELIANFLRHVYKCEECLFTVFNVDKAYLVSSNVVIGIYHSYIIAAGGVEISNGRDRKKSSFFQIIKTIRTSSLVSCFPDGVRTFICNTYFIPI